MHKPLKCGRALALFALATAVALDAEPVAVRYKQGSAHGFLSLSTLDGKRIATGDLTQVVHGDRVVSRLTFRFRDGSIDDDTTAFTQNGTFRLVTDHHIQRGPSFPKPIDVTINAMQGKVISRREDGTLTEDSLEIPTDVSNGLPLTLLLNLVPTTAETVVSYVAPTTKPSLVHIHVKPNGKVAFKVAGGPREAVDYLLHVDLGPVKGAIAPLVGKQPADTNIWIMTGTSPAFIREEGQLYQGGPVWRIEQISPTFAE